MKSESSFKVLFSRISPFLTNFRSNILVYFFIVFSIASIFGSMVMLSSSATVPVYAASSDIPPVSGIEILKYESSIAQEPGTRSTYEVKVENIGVLGLSGVSLTAEKIPAGWFSSNDTLGLEFGKTGDLKYELAIPEDASGMLAFSLVAKGSYGPGVVTDIVPVVLNVVVLPQPTLPTTTTTEQPQATTTQPPIISVSKSVSDLLNFLNPENAFSKFRDGVAYVGATARGILTDDTLIYKTAAALFVVVVVLVIIRKAMMGRAPTEE
jgi:hypothetical protein